MDNAFKSRLDEVFGGLGSATGAPGWSVSSSEVERRQWLPESESGDEGEDNEEDAGCSNGQPKRAGVEDGEDDELEEIQAMVGMDTTLDYEDEEDAYDKVAVGREDAGHRIYMSGIKEEVPHAPPSVFNELRNQKDSRALRQAAADRLAEDAEEAKLSGNAELYRAFSKGGQANEKRKQDAGSKMDVEKRVRFLVPDSAPGENTKSTKEARNVFRDRYKNVPDHVRHPEKYTHYTLDWSEEDHGDNNNVRAWHDAIAAAKSSSENEANVAAPELPQHITFVPRSSSRKEKDRDCVMVDAVTPAVNITVEMNAEDENGTEDDSSQFKRARSSGGRRSYRKKNEQDE